MSQQLTSCPRCRRPSQATDLCEAFRTWDAQPLKDVEGQSKGPPPCDPCAQAGALRRHAQDQRAQAGRAEAHAQQLVVARHGGDVDRPDVCRGTTVQGRALCLELQVSRLEGELHQLAERTAAQLDLVQRALAGEPDDSLAADHGGTGWEAHPAVQAARLARDELALRQATITQHRVAAEAAAARVQELEAAAADDGR